MTEDISTDSCIALLGELLEDQGQEDGLEMEAALERAQDSLAFTQSLWNLFSELQLHQDGASPDYYKMENIIDSINGELGAAVLFLNSLSIDSEAELLRNAELLEVFSKTDTSNSIPYVIIEGNRRLAARVKNTKKLMEAQQITADQERT